MMGRLAFAKSCVQQAQYERIAPLPTSFWGSVRETAEIQALMDARDWTHAIAKGSQPLFTVDLSRQQAKMVPRSIRGQQLLELIYALQPWVNRLKVLTFEPRLEAMLQELLSVGPALAATGWQQAQTLTVMCDALNGMVMRLRQQLGTPKLMTKIHAQEKLLRARKSHMSKTFAKAMAQVEQPSIMNLDLMIQFFDEPRSSQAAVAQARAELVQRLRTQFGGALVAQAWKFDLDLQQIHRIHQTFVLDGCRGAERQGLFEAIWTELLAGTRGMGSSWVVDCDGLGSGLSFRGHDAVDPSVVDVSERLASSVTYHVEADELVAVRALQSDALWGASSFRT